MLVKCIDLCIMFYPRGHQHHAGLVLSNSVGPLSERTDRVQVSTAAVVLCQVAPQALVHICAAQHEQEARPAQHVSNKLECNTNASKHNNS